MDAALGAGVNFFDTANVYGWGANKGRTEEIVGSWFAKGGGRRDKTVLATKVYGNMATDGEPVWPNHDKLSALNIRRAVDASLKRLGTDHIDLYQFHHVDRDTPWDEIWQAIDVLVQQGKILYVGSSNHAGWHIARANETAARRGSLGLVSEQCLYNLAERRAEMEVIPAAQGYGLGVIPWSPLHGGLLGGAIRKEREGGAARSASGRSADALANSAIRAQIQSYEDLLDKHGLEPGEVALAWLLTRPGVTGPIVGPRTADQLASALRAVELDLSDELLASLDEIFPGPGPLAGGLRLVSGPGARRPGDDRPPGARHRPRQPQRKRRRHDHDDEQHGEQAGHDPVTGFGIHPLSVTGAGSEVSAARVRGPGHTARGPDAHGPPPGGTRPRDPWPRAAAPPRPAVLSAPAARSPPSRTGAACPPPRRPADGCAPAPAPRPSRRAGEVLQGARVRGGVQVGGAVPGEGEVGVYGAVLSSIGTPARRAAADAESASLLHGRPVALGPGPHHPVREPAAAGDPQLVGSRCAARRAPAARAVRAASSSATSP